MTKPSGGKKSGLRLTAVKSGGTVARAAGLLMGSFILSNIEDSYRVLMIDSSPCKTLSPYLNGTIPVS